MTLESGEPKKPSQETLDALVRVVGEDYAIREPEGMAPFLVEWRDRYVGKAALVLKPGTPAPAAGTGGSASRWSARASLCGRSRPSPHTGSPRAVGRCRASTATGA